MLRYMGGITMSEFSKQMAIIQDTANGDLSAINRIHPGDAANNTAPVHEQTKPKLVNILYSNGWVGQTDSDRIQMLYNELSRKIEMAKAGLYEFSELEKFAVWVLETHRKEYGFDFLKNKFE
jgi:hypothetical protein